MPRHCAKCFTAGVPNLGNRVAQQEVSGGRAKLHLYLQPLPIIHITAWAPPPDRSAVALDSHRSSNPTVNCTCKGSRLRAPYENLMPDDLRRSWGSDASAGEWLQIQIIISREVWLHRDHNKAIACRLISKPYQWVASENKLRAHTDSGELYNYFIIYYNVIIIEIKCTINVMCLNHPKTIPPPLVHDKIVFHETGPWCQKGWGPLLHRHSNLTVLATQLGR